MAKTILGVDIGHDQLKLALVRGKQVLKTVAAPMPENLLKQGRISSRDSMGELIKSTMKAGGVHAGKAAFVLQNDVVFVKNVDIPPMSVEQLKYNLPFEFNDYITGEVKDYVFDYAVLSDPPPAQAKDKKAKKEKKPKGKAAKQPEAPQQTEAEAAANAAVDAALGVASEPTEPETIQLMAAGTTRAVLEEARDALRKAGLKLMITAPAISAFISLIRAQSESLSSVAEEYCMLDLGYESIRMYMFHGDRHSATRVLEVGMSTLDNVLAEVYGVDVHLAHTYLMSNFENCQQREECMNAYSNIAVELMRALNFYRFSNRDSVLEHMWLCGGGAVIEPLRDTIGEMLNIELRPASELIPGGENVPEANTYAQAIGIAMSE